MYRGSIRKAGETVQLIATSNAGQRGTVQRQLKSGVVVVKLGNGETVRVHASALSFARCA